MQSSNASPLVLPSYIERVLFSEKEIQTRVRELGNEITRDFRDASQAPLIVCIMKGGLLFFSDLVRAIDLDIEWDFMVLSSYNGGVHSTGEVKIRLDLNTRIEGRDVIIVEDIVDTGRTMQALLDLLGTRHPKSVKVCTLLDKPSRRVVSVPIRYVGFEIEDVFVIGYGMDIKEKRRQLRYVGVYKQAA
jgi:hypoxanthine phosphoribosyltransferase